jgi:C1A family cysteine protease
MSESNLSLDRIRGDLGKAGDPWEAGVTSVSALTAEEQAALLGVTPPPDEASIDEVEAGIALFQESLKVEAEGDVGAPSAYDLRNVGGKNYITPIRDQKNCGSCVAFGTVATVEGQLRVQRKNPNLNVDLSEAHMFFCHAFDDGRNCGNGWWPNKAFDAFKTKGVADEACYPYASGLSKKNCSGLCSNWSARVTKISGYVDLTKKSADIKNWIATKGPVCACFIVYKDFFSYKSGVYKHVSGDKAGGHCVTIVGYNNNGGYGICKNSWGTGWGEKGFFRIAYGQCGIDSWLNHGVNSVVNTGWHKNKKVTGLWANHQERNAHAHFQGLGWRKISSAQESSFLCMLSDLVAAKAAGRPVKFYEENGVIKQVYVF